MAGSVPRTGGGALPPPDAERRARTIAFAVYALYGAGFITGLAFVVGAVIAHLKRDEAPGWLRTHLTFQIRTFWIGLLWALVGMMTTWLLVGFLFLAWSFVFVLVRTVRGFLRLNDDRPIDDPQSWAFG
jgi:uncharacterized membrane protein